jgi:hypothetical protein
VRTSKPSEVVKMNLVPILKKMRQESISCTLKENVD